MWPGLGTDTLGEYAQVLIDRELYSDTAIFRQVDKDCDFTHHDALETPDGQIVKLNGLSEGQIATVLQLPAAPKSDAEAKEQERLAIVA